MADVTVSYKGGTIAEMDGSGSKTLKTGGWYCEGDISVEYTPRSRTYEVTLAHVGGWTLLVDLDDDVLAHIDDPGLIVSLMYMDEYETVNYTTACAIATNRIIAYNGSYPMYGIANRQANATTLQNQGIAYPANYTGTSTGLGGYAIFRVSGGKYYIMPGDGGVKAGTYRLTFTW